MKTGTLLGLLVTSAVVNAVGCKQQDPSSHANDNPAAHKSNPSGTPKAPTVKQEIYKVPVGKSSQKGPDDALVTIVEFSDFQCPFCARVLPTLNKVQETFGDDVRLVFKHQPLPFHRQAPLASEYALAAGEQGKFWEMHDKLFAHQKELKEEQLKAYAAELGLDQAKIDEYLASGKGKEMIKEDQTLARKIGANGTPAFFINGAKLSGAQPYAKFEATVKDAISRAETALAQGVDKKAVYAKLIENGRDSVPPRRPRPPEVRQKLVLQEGTPTKGSSKPLVTLVEFSDFECPFCSRVNPTLAKIMETYGDDVQVQFRNQPLGFHKRAKPAALAALAAHKQGKFWEMHDKLFANQRALSDEDLKKYAKEIGLDVDRFEADLISDEVAKILAQDQKDAAKFGARGTPTLFANGVPIRGAQPFAAFKKIIDEELVYAKKLLSDGTPRDAIYQKVIETKGGEKLAQRGPSKPSAPPVPSKPVDVQIGDAPTEGKKDAPIKLVIFSDFECPFCSRVNASIERVKETYGDKVSVSFKHFPLGFHKRARPAAVASLAAHKQGKFWEMHDKLFANQRELTKESFVAFAAELGLDLGKFEADLDDPALTSWVDSDMKQGSSVGVRGTPASFVNGRLVSGAVPFEAFQKIIDEELKKDG
ncbi:MAG: thioredoxin domain-containing protein [Myxococcales bacterium]|nr:thioredoxin domain-containing protein [Myxococcales bacterium]